MTDADVVLQPYATLLAQPADVAADLERFVELLRKWNQVQNLVSRETVEHVWRRHIADSLQLLPLLGPSDRRLVDLGSGGGFPAVPVAIATRGTDRRYLLIEPIGKKASFLRTVVRELQLPATIESRRAEAVDSRETDVVTSRALAPLPLLLRLAAPFFGRETRGLFHKGREHVEELRQASAEWAFDVVIHPSATESGAAILDIANLRARSAR